MKKLQVFGISLFILLAICFISLVSAIMINEVELNPEGTDTGKEWIELYSNSEVNLFGFSIKNYDNNTINLSGIFSGFYLVNLSSQWLDNSNEKVFLLANGTIIDETMILNDNYDDNRSWQFCSGNWIFTDSTPGIENFCLQQNQTQQNQTSDTYLELDYDKTVRNGEVFKIKVKAFNLLNKDYDVKVYIEDNETLLSEIYDDNEEEWKSGIYYIDTVFSGSGNKSESLRLRIMERYGDFVGDVKVKAKIRISGVDSVIAEIEDDIEIEKKIAEEIMQDSSESSEKEEEVAERGITGSVIKLNQPKDINMINNNQTYKSTTQYIKEYGIYGFALFCVFVIIILLIKNRKLR